MSPVKTTMDAAPPVTVQRVRRARSFRRPVRMWVASAFFVLAYAAIVAFVLLAVRMVVQGDRSLGYVALGCLGGFVLLRICAAWCAAGITCNLCHGEVLRSRRCTKHGLAKKFPLMTYRITAVLQVVFTLRFTCMYCGSPFRLRQ